MKPIRTPEDHRGVLEEIASLMGAAPGTPEAERLEVLAVLASDYERREMEAEADPVDVLGVAMRGKGLGQAELSEVLGSRARASEILSRRRGLSAEMIERIARAWAIPRRLLAGPVRAAATPRGRGLRTTMTVFLVGTSLVAAAGLTPFALYGRDLPDIAPLVAEGRQAGDVASLPPHVVQAFIAAEDKNFLSHAGTDPAALARATGVTLARGGAHSEGGATLTQQLVKNTLLAGEGRSVRRKVREILLSHRLESALSKDQILRLYLDHVYFGGGAYGLDAAAHFYFGRPAARLSVGQAAYLAALVDAPNDRRFDRPANRPRALAARDTVVVRMARAGFVTPALAQAAERERLW
jgi:penicillin-binding protein 1A